MNRLYGFILILTVLSFAPACTQGPPVPFPAIDFTVEDIFNGEEIHLEEAQGSPVLIYFFASW